MDKLRHLLKQLGGSDELVAAISEEFNRFAQGIKEKYDVEFRQKLERARTVCLEEVNKEKAALARKFSVYLEAKTNAIEKAAEKLRLNEDTEATNTLKQAKALLEGIDINSGDSRELQATRKKNERLTAVISTLKEERNQAVRKSNDANKVALKALEKNRVLEEHVAQHQAVLAEAKKRVEQKKTLTESKRLDKNRNEPQQGKSTRRTLVESQVKSGKSKSGKPDNAIAGIAANMDE